MNLEGFLALNEDLGIYTDQYAQFDVRLIYSWARMLVNDEVGKFNKATNITFVDFLECLGLMAEAVQLPSAKFVADAGYENILQWYIDSERPEPEVDPSYEWGNKQTVPLHHKLEIFLDFMFRRLHYQVGFPESEILDMEAYTKRMKKLDHDMGA